MPLKTNHELKDGDHCVVVKGTYKSRSEPLTDIYLSKTGHINITVIQDSGTRFKLREKMWKFPNESIPL